EPPRWSGPGGESAESQDSALFSGFSAAVCRSITRARHAPNPAIGNLVRADGLVQRLRLCPDRRDCGRTHSKQSAASARSAKHLWGRADRAGTGVGVLRVAIKVDPPRLHVAKTQCHLVW